MASAIAWETGAAPTWKAPTWEKSYLSTMWGELSRCKSMGGTTTTVVTLCLSIIWHILSKSYWAIRTVVLPSKRDILINRKRPRIWNRGTMASRLPSLCNALLACVNWFSSTALAIKLWWLVICQYQNHSINIIAFLPDLDALWRTWMISVG